MKKPLKKRKAKRQLKRKGYKIPARHFNAMGNTDGDIRSDAQRKIDGD